jgi:signal transduction histidine kinase
MSWTRRFASRVWRSAAVCGLHLPLTIFYPAVVITLLVLSIALLPLFLLGVPLLGVTFAVTRAFAEAERGRSRGVLAVSVDAPSPQRIGWWRGVLDDVRSAQTWRQLGYFTLVLPVLGSVGYVLPFALGGFGVAALLVPALGSTIPSNPVVHLGIHRLGWWWALFGIAALVAACLVVQGCAYAWSWTVRALLGRGMEEQLSERIETLTESRDALAAAAEAERVRIERDLHDGAQQRLVALAMNLGMAREKLQTDPKSAGSYVTQAHEEAKAALAELRNIARGIYPVVLADRGLDAALSAVAARLRIPVEVDVQIDPRPARPVEAVAYFVVAEALTNVAKHSEATAAVVRARRTDNRLMISVLDNGHGGADASKGTGLAGLVHRVQGADGTMTVTSPAGGPTTIIVELPCAS